MVIVEVYQVITRKLPDVSAHVSYPAQNLPCLSRMPTKGFVYTVPVRSIDDRTRDVLAPSLTVGLSRLKVIQSQRCINESMIDSIVPLSGYCLLKDRHASVEYEGRVITRCQVLLGPQLGDPVNDMRENREFPLILKAREDQMTSVSRPCEIRPTSPPGHRPFRVRAIPCRARMASSTASAVTASTSSASTTVGPCPVKTASTRRVPATV